jgi:hypothetical protein
VLYLSYPSRTSDYYDGVWSAGGFDRPRYNGSWSIQVTIATGQWIGVEVEMARKSGQVRIRKVQASCSAWLWVVVKRDGGRHRDCRVWNLRAYCLRDEGLVYL